MTPDTPRPEAKRDHGGGIDAAARRFGGARADWLDLSTGINPVSYPVQGLDPDDWTALPDSAAQDRLLAAARAFWQVPDGAAILAAPGASALIAQIPTLAAPGRVAIPTPTYNEHAASFGLMGWDVAETGPADAQVLVHPNNPDGRIWQAEDLTAPLGIVDESFGDVCPDQSLIALAPQAGRIILKSFGKFWGLAGLRLGFAIGDPALVGALADRLGPWPVSGPALRVGAAALCDTAWADATRARLARDAARLDALFTAQGAQIAGGTTLFRLYRVDDAAAWQTRLARHRIWTRVFPYSRQFLRVGLPPDTGWARIEAAV
ncbi:MAG: pyridoxal phosphate-dependent class II aminotransferase [Marinibacterium sp.]|nr:pyridoxal phosphate-dependent class II aminotransferase [Marinibacterium sp.]